MIEIALLNFLRELFSSKLGGTIIESVDGADDICEPPRNAKCADIIYELAWFAYAQMADDDGYPGSGENRLNPVKGQIERQWFPGHSSSGEWSADLLIKAGVFEPQWPYHSPLMSLEEVRHHDFSSFETPDGYTECMRALWVLLGQFSSPAGATMWDISVSHVSPDFLDRIVLADDAFGLKDQDCATYDYERLGEKVLEPWMKLSQQGQIGKVFKI